MHKTRKTITRARKYKGNGGFTIKNISGNTNSKGLGVRTFRFHRKHNKKRWTTKQ